MRPPITSNQNTGGVTPSCTLARGRSETLIRGRDGATRSGPQPTMKNAPGQVARAAAARER